MKIIEKVHISDIKPGDWIVHNGEERTVCEGNIKKDDGFMGRSIFGDCYRCGYRPVLRITYLSPTPEVIYYADSGETKTFATLEDYLAWLNRAYLTC